MKKRRKRGTGAIHLRKDGRWEDRYVVGYDDKNRPITKNVLARTKAVCAEKLKQLMASCAAPADEAPRAGMTFGAWMDLWYQTYCKPNLRPTTQADYENNIYRHIIPELGNIPLTKLTQGNLQQFYNRLRSGGRLIRTETYGQGLSPRMVRACHANCRAALDRAVSEGLLRVNPAVGCAVPANSGKEMQGLTRDEMKRFLIQAREEGYYEFFLLELATGLRRGEVLALQWDDLNPGTGELRIQRQVCRIQG